MTTADLIRHGRPVLRQFDTGLADCRVATVLPDLRIAVLGNLSALAVVDLDSGEVKRYPLTDEWGLKSIVGLTGRRVLLVNIKKILLYQLGDGGLAQLKSWRIETKGSVIDVAAAVSGPRFAVAAGDRLYVGRVDRPDLDVIDSADCVAVSVSSNGDIVAACRSGGTIDTYAGQPLGRWQEMRVNDNDVPILSVGISPDGRRVVAGDDATQTMLFDTDTGTSSWLDSAGKAVAASWSDDGSVFAVVALTRLVNLHDRSGQLLKHLVPAESGTYYFVGGGWTSQTSELVVGSEHGQILVWSFDGARPR